MKNKKMKALMFLALTIGTGIAVNAQDFSDVSRAGHLNLRANNDGSSNSEFIRFYTGRSNELSGTNFIAQISNRALTLRGREPSSTATVIGAVGTHFQIDSFRGLRIHSDTNNNNNGGETIILAVGNTDIINITGSAVTYNKRITMNDTNSANNRIGIGTATPATSMHVRGGNVRVDNGEYQSFGPIVLHADVDGSGDDDIQFKNSTNDIMARLQDGNLNLNIINNTGGEIRSTGNLVFRPDSDSNGGDDRIVFRNSANREMVRIQDGVITTDQVRLNVTTFPDYVFAKDYNLMPLNEVSQYIKANKHLPNMPTEAEVVAEGMNVGQINTILVEKVEELTLHTINQEEKIEMLMKRIEALEATINK